MRVARLPRSSAGSTVSCCGVDARRSERADYSQEDQRLLFQISFVKITGLFFNVLLFNKRARETGGVMTGPQPQNLPNIKAFAGTSRSWKPYDTLSSSGDKNSCHSNKRKPRPQPKIIQSKDIKSGIIVHIPLRGRSNLEYRIFHTIGHF